MYYCGCCHTAGKPVLVQEKRRVGWGWMAVGKGGPFTYVIASTGWITTAHSTLPQPRQYRKPRRKVLQIPLPDSRSQITLQTGPNRRFHIGCELLCLCITDLSKCLTVMNVTWMTAHKLEFQKKKCQELIFIDKKSLHNLYHSFISSEADYCE